MSRHTWQTRVEAYIARRREQGYGMTSQRYVLLGFARFAENEGSCGPLTLDLARRWAESGSSTDLRAGERRLTILRNFARYLAEQEPETEVPPFGMLGPARSPLAHVRHDRLRTDLADRLRGYVALRRNLGNQIKTQEVLLLAFARHVGVQSNNGSPARSAMAMYSR